jgi:hypothetical protein
MQQITAYKVKMVITHANTKATGGSKIVKKKGIEAGGSHIISARRQTRHRDAGVPSRVSKVTPERWMTYPPRKSSAQTLLSAMAIVGPRVITHHHTNSGFASGPR